MNEVRVVSDAVTVPGHVHLRRPIFVKLKIFHRIHHEGVDQFVEGARGHAARLLRRFRGRCGRFGHIGFPWLWGLPRARGFVPRCTAWL